MFDIVWLLSEPCLGSLPRQTLPSKPKSFRPSVSWPSSADQPSSAPGNSKGNKMWNHVKSAAGKSSFLHLRGSLIDQHSMQMRPHQEGQITLHWFLCKPKKHHNTKWSAANNIQQQRPSRHFKEQLRRISVSTVASQSSKLLARLKVSAGLSCSPAHHQ